MMTAEATRVWTVLSLLEWGATYLTDRGFEEARLNVDLLLAHVLRLRRLDLYLQFDRPLLAEELAQFKSLFSRRLRHEPLQYILGETEFMGLTLEVNSSVLIPRPETELLVEKTREAIGRLNIGTPDILDVGTGSGNIAIALAHFVPEARVTAIDISRAALETAARNVSRHAQKNVTLMEKDLFDDSWEGFRFHLLVSNPPYIPLDEFQRLQPEVREYEPSIATTDGGDGLRLIRRIAHVAPRLLHEGGLLMMEIGFNQSADVQTIAGAEGFVDMEIFNDEAGIGRVFRGSVPQRSLP